ncbi:MAG: AAA family ATPase [bacterium]
MVTCIFSIESASEIELLLEDTYEIPKDLEKKIQSLNNCIALIKKWDPERPLDKPVLDIENKELKKYFENLIITNSSLNIETVEKVPPSPEDANVAFQTKEQIKKKQLTSKDFALELFHYAPVITLFEDRSLLPPTIDIADIQEKNEEKDGYVGALNFLTLTELTSEELANHQSNERLIRDKINAANLKISNEFQQFWSQFLGSNDKILIQADIKNYDKSNAEKVGQPYLSFWIKDNNGSLRPIQRSMGVRWFISFFLTLKATAKKDNHRILLIDEAGANLHAKAQADILKILESEKANLQIIYATHSPYLLNIEKVHRVLAVERKEVDSYKTVTKVYKFHELGSATAETLFPLYTNMGVDISHQQVIKKENNVLLEEISAFFYLKAFYKLFNKQEEVNFLPATGCTQIPLLANLLLGWGINFSVVVDDDSRGREVIKKLKDNHIRPEHKLIKVENCSGIEDIFSNEEFTKLVLNKAETQIPAGKKVSEYVKKSKKISKPLIARDFLLKVENGEITKAELSPETEIKIDELLTKIVQSLR